MTILTTMNATISDAAPARAPRFALSARARIVGWMLFIAAIALACAILVTAQVLNVRVEELANQRLTHAADSFRTFATSPSGRSQYSVDALLTRYLQDTVPSRAETSFSLLDGAPHRRTVGHPPVRLDKDPAFIRTIAEVSEPVHGHLDTAAGRVKYAVLPVRVAGDPHQGAMVTAVFQDDLAGPFFAALQIFAVVALAAVALAGVVGWLVAGRVLAPVRLVRTAAEKISETDLRRRIPVTGTDDIAQLTHTFNRMLDRLETAFSAQQQFVDDAGHELRTPITVVRGHLELMGDSVEERHETVALVSDELRRMNRIVDDLLVLAKAGQPDFLVMDDVDLADLTVDVLANARMLGQRRWVLDEFAEGRILADGQRLAQALMQLAMNAVQHTGEGDTVAIGSKRVDDHVLLWVRDTGVGVSQTDLEHIFERFHRGAGRARTAGAGLGLSIVRSIARAHLGEVAVHSELGHGAKFVLELPAGRHPEGRP